MELKVIGLLGGMSPESTSLYYKWINNEVQNRLGAQNSAEILLRSINFEQIKTLQYAGKWDELGDLLAKRASELVLGGAEIIGLCTKYNA